MCRNDIEEQLRAIDDIRILREVNAPLRMDSGGQQCCTIVDVEASLPEDELLLQLNTTSPQSRVYDCHFHGITPLNEYGNTQVE